MASTVSIPLRGAGGEPVHYWRTVISHGVTDLAPMRIDAATQTFQVTLATPDGPRIVSVASPDPATAVVTLLPDATPAVAEAVERGIRRFFALNTNLAPFYDLAAADPDLAWVSIGAGRMGRCASAFEEVIKTICTTNCSWGATVRMASNLVTHLGEAAPEAPAEAAFGRLFPTAATMATADEAFYKEVIRAGYRGSYMRSIAAMVASGELDLDALCDADPADLPDDELRQRLIALPGIGPYAAAHMMMLIGRSSRLVFDSWTRPKYARIVGLDAVSDSDIEARFSRYGEWAGLGFWLFLSKDWDEATGGPTAE